jgi:NAD(P)-dependent dehydrogenase (short-subunit alcohol dehydrogenase family)
VTTDQIKALRPFLRRLATDPSEEGAWRIVGADPGIGAYIALHAAFRPGLSFSDVYTNEEPAPAPPAQGRGEIERLVHAAVYERHDSVAAEAAVLAAFDRSLAAQDGLREALQRVRILATNGNPMSPEKAAITMDMIDSLAKAALSAPAAPKKETEHHE